LPIPVLLLSPACIILRKTSDSDLSSTPRLPCGLRYDPLEETLGWAGVVSVMASAALRAGRIEVPR
jgi:hypothetical protein